jgi:hypothetical protein
MYMKKNITTVLYMKILYVLIYRVLVYLIKINWGYMSEFSYMS